MSEGAKSLPLQVPFVSLARQFGTLRAELHAALDRVGDSGMYVLGNELKQFEDAAAAFCGTRFALGVANGSDALFLVMKALHIGPGDEVITPPNSFIATAWTIAATGATPVFVDVTDDFNIDPALIEAAVTPRTKAILPVHLTGRIARMEQVCAIATKHNLLVIEDAAQAIGAKLGGKRSGAFGIAGCFSLHPLKNLGVYGDGGLITTNDEALYSALIQLRNHGLRNRDECDEWGFNSRLDPLQAAFGLVKLKYLDRWNDACRRIASRYRAALERWVKTPNDRADEESVYHNFVILTDHRDELMRHMAGMGVGTRIHYPIPIHLQKAAKGLGHGVGSFPVTERLAKQMISLPIYPELQEQEIAQVIRSIESYFAKQGELRNKEPSAAAE